MKDALSNQLERMFQPVYAQPSSTAPSELAPWVHEYLGILLTKTDLVTAVANWSSCH